MKFSAFLVFLPIATALSVPAAAEEDPCERKISITGHAEASHIPDFITLTLASDSKAPTVPGALEASAKSVAEIGALARELGVTNSDIRTASIVLEEGTRTISRTLGPDQREPDGFRVSNRVSIRLADRSRTGEFVRRIVEKGSIRIEFVELGLDDRSKAETALLVAAGQDARARAAALAEATATKAGVVCSLKAGSVQQTWPITPVQPIGRQKKYGDYSSDPDYRYSGASGKPALYVPLESGTIDLAIDVSAEFAAQP